MDRPPDALPFSASGSEGRKPTSDARAACTLQARGLTVRFGSRVILDALELALAGGELVAIVGAAGAGKTILLRGLAAMLQPTSGTVLWNGEPAGRRPGARRLVGFIGSQPVLRPDLTVVENLHAAGRMQGLADPRARAAELLKLAQLERWAEQLAGRLSKGVQQRVALACGLAHDPAILLVDEPFSVWDAPNQHWFAEWLSAIRPRTICGTASGFAAWIRSADRALRLEAGKLAPLAGERGEFRAGAQTLPRSA